MVPGTATPWEHGPRFWHGFRPQNAAKSVGTDCRCPHFLFEIEATLGPDFWGLGKSDYFAPLSTANRNHFGLENRHKLSFVWFAYLGCMHAWCVQVQISLQKRFLNRCKTIPRCMQTFVSIQAPMNTRGIHPCTPRNGTAKHACVLPACETSTKSRQHLFKTGSTHGGQSSNWNGKLARHDVQKTQCTSILGLLYVDACDGPANPCGICGSGMLINQIKRKYWIDQGAEFIN